VARAENEKLAAYATAADSAAELQAHIGRLRVDREVKSSVEAAATAINERLEVTGRRDAQDLVITREKLVDAVEELEHLRHGGHCRAAAAAAAANAPAAAATAPAATARVANKHSTDVESSPNLLCCAYV